MVDSVHLAELARLQYVTDDRPGFSRRRNGVGFVYVSPSGRPLGDRRKKKRIEALAIPPAWKEVWICADSNGHLQATGIDDRGRKQYLYHPRWQTAANLAKFEALENFGKALPTIRERVDRDLRRRPGRDQTAAVLVALLDASLMRVGNEDYARQNGSYGLTTLRRRHVRVSGAAVSLNFPSKSGKRQSVAFENRRLARLINRFLSLGCNPIFQYPAGEGRLEAADSLTVNDYLREVSGEDITAKDFRTWKATAIVAERLLEEDSPETEARRRRHLNAAIRMAAEKLGNTATVCRKSYVHPRLAEAYLAGDLQRPARRLRQHPRLEAKDQLLLKLFKCGALATSFADVNAPPC